MKKIAINIVDYLREYSCFVPDQRLLRENFDVGKRLLEIAYQQSPSIIQSKMSLEQSELALIQQKASLKSQIQFEPEPVSIHQKHVV